MERREKNSNEIRGIKIKSATTQSDESDGEPNCLHIIFRIVLLKAGATLSTAQNNMQHIRRNMRKRVEMMCTLVRGILYPIYFTRTLYYRPYYSSR